ncbi:cobalamin biosynthesis protein CbiX [Actinoplanes sp. LDG1-06]|uniref:Cobalamin biosynthesis protein CbiX n=1 Tax=Paractinoplanes ovalisporus TaxID=2810368 RepID=A0ABS2AMR3_9ACTN|nr:CbiX/SirB N-terminal domain-containing protein [Actinoplanes ovalisporus]MBM2621147.1 cobalamin biosynthesis protein CbiX [Actinoplanes ovalisporus]
MRTARLTDRLAVVLVAHGSRDPRAAASTQALARAVRRAHPAWDVYASFLDHAGPRPLDVLESLPGRRAVLVPLLLTEAFHGRVDVPAIVAEAASLPVDVSLAGVLGPSPSTSSPVPGSLIDGLVRRLEPVGLDAVVLAAAGTRDARARETITWAADALSARLSLPCVAAYASASPPLPGAVVGRLRASGARRVGMASYFLAPGFLYDVAVRSAREAGAVVVAPPLGDAPELVRLVASRVLAAVGSALSAAA